MKKTLIIMALILFIFSAIGFAAAPVHDTNPVLNTEGDAPHTVSEDLTCTQNTSDPESDPIKNIFNWKIGPSLATPTSITVLNMPFEGGSNSTFTEDYSGNGNNGSVIDAVWNSTGGQDDFGAYEFDGDGDYISTSGVSVNDKGFTISMWIYPKFENQFRMVETGSSSNEYFAIYSSDNKLIGRSINSTGGSTLTCYSNINKIYENNWYHIAYVNTNTSRYIYINGVDETAGSCSVVGGLSTSTTRADYIGKYTSAGYDFNGTIDDLKIYNRALSPEQIAELAAGNDDIWVAEETALNDKVICSVTPADATDAGSTADSNEVTIVADPTFDCTNGLGSGVSLGQIGNTVTFYEAGNPIASVKLGGNGDCGTDSLFDFKDNGGGSSSNVVHKGSTSTNIGDKDIFTNVNTAWHLANPDEPVITFCPHALDLAGVDANCDCKITCDYNQLFGGTCDIRRNYGAAPGCAPDPVLAQIFVTAPYGVGNEFRRIIINGMEKTGVYQHPQGDDPPPPPVPEFSTIGILLALLAVTIGLGFFVFKRKH